MSRTSSFTALLLVVQAACVLTTGAQAEDTPPPADPVQAEWVLAEIDGTAAGWSATLNLAEADKVSGQAPCNRYGASLTRDGASFVLGPIAATRMACADLAAEAEFFRLLAGVSTLDAAPDALILAGGGHQMRFIPPKN